MFVSVPKQLSFTTDASLFSRLLFLTHSNMRHASTDAHRQVAVCYQCLRQSYSKSSGKDSIMGGTTQGETRHPVHVKVRRSPVQLSRSRHLRSGHQCWNCSNKRHSFSFLWHPQRKRLPPASPREPPRQTETRTYPSWAALLPVFLISPLLLAPHQEAVSSYIWMTRVWRKTRRVAFRHTV